MVLQNDSNEYEQRIKETSQKGLYDILHGWICMTFLYVFFVDKSLSLLAFKFVVLFILGNTGEMSKIALVFFTLVTLATIYIHTFEHPRNGIYVDFLQTEGVRVWKLIIVDLLTTAVQLVYLFNKPNRLAVATENGTENGDENTRSFGVYDGMNFSIGVDQLFFQPPQTTDIREGGAAVSTTTGNSRAPTNTNMNANVNANVNNNTSLIVNDTRQKDDSANLQGTSQPTGSGSYSPRRTNFFNATNTSAIPGFDTYSSPSSNISDKGCVSNTPRLNNDAGVSKKNTNRSIFSSPSLYHEGNPNATHCIQNADADELTPSRVRAKRELSSLKLSQAVAAGFGEGVARSGAPFRDSEESFELKETGVKNPFVN